MKQQLLSLLEPFGQEHLLRFWDELSEPQREVLAGQIRSIDFDLIQRLYGRRDVEIDATSFAERGKEPPAYRCGILSEGNYKSSAPFEIPKSRAIAAGEVALAAGRYAVLIVAGGQGTRLGFPHPKGMFPIGPVQKTTLFQIHCEKVLALAKRFKTAVPLCLMSSPATHEETIDFLGKNDWFGIPENDRFLFCQGTMPAVDLANGKVLLSEKGQIALSPDGHGGMLAAISKPQKAGKPSVLDRLHERGIEHLFYFQVDNPLVDICGREFLGYHLLNDSELTSQVIRKQSPSDRVGNIVELDGKLHVIEYSDIPASLANRRRVDGSLEIWAGSIAVHQFKLDFLRRLAPSGTALPFHIAKKKVPFIDPATAAGSKIEPPEPNAVKFERFIFDLLPSAQNAVVVEVDPARNYAPLKNASGAEEHSPEAVRAQIAAFYAEWLEKAGAQVVPGTPIEISPLFADRPEELKRFFKPGIVFNRPIYMR